MEMKFRLDGCIFRWTPSMGNVWFLDARCKGIWDPGWIYIGSVFFSECGWLWWLISPNRYRAVNSAGEMKKWRTLEEAKEWVESSAERVVANG